MSPATRRRLAVALTMVLATLLGGALALDLHGGCAAPHGPYDVIVVAGAGVLADGRPSEPLRSRALHAARLHREGVAPRVFLTGGVGRFGAAESVVAERVVRAAGVPANAISREERSTSTEENAAYAAAQLGPGARVLLVTDRFHVLRARRVFARHFRHVDAVGAVSAPWPRFRGAVREVLAVAAYAALGRL